MHKKRLIFTLLYADGYFFISRNFQLQKVGNSKWLNKNYNFKNIASSIDELIILNVSRKEKDQIKFISAVQEVIEGVFVPVALGGGIRTMEDASLFLSSGADKIVVNTLIEEDRSVIKELVSKYGSQCIVASIDYRLVDKSMIAFTNNGEKQVSMTLEEYILKIKNLNVGEIFINSIDRDGTGQGYDFKSLIFLSNIIDIPIIISGGAGKKEHFLEVLLSNEFDAASTAHLFNFIGNGLPLSRSFLLKNDVSLAKW